MEKKKIKLAYKNMLRHVADNAANSPEQKGLTNCYTCKKCHHVDKYTYADSGATPMVVACTNCKQRSSVSAMMKPIAKDLAPNQEWFRPSLPETYKMVNYPHMLNHVLNGGLLRRNFTPLTLNP